MSEKKVPLSSNIIRVEHEIMRKGCPRCKSTEVKFRFQRLCHDSEKGCMYDVISYVCLRCGFVYEERFDLPHEHWKSIEKTVKEFQEQEES